MTQPKLYRVSFVQQDKVYEIYCRSFSNSHLYGFLEMEQLLFGERTQVLVDPAEEKLKAEFHQVERSHIPYHSVIRIDEVAEQGVNRIRDHKGTVTPFPQPARPPAHN